MNLQQQIAEAIIATFEDFGGNPQNAIDSARHHSSIDSWVQQETTKVVISGAGEMVIPGLHALTIPAGITYLIHKMASLTWGIGFLSRAYILEDAYASDLRNILMLWAEGEGYNASLLHHIAISRRAFEHAFTENGQRQIEAIRERRGSVDPVLLNTVNILQSQVVMYSGSERAVQQIRAASGDGRARELQQMAQNLPSLLPAMRSPQVQERVSTRLALRVAGRISARIPARFVVGFIPIAGAIVNAFFNAQTLRSFAEIATKYYSHSLTVQDMASLSRIETETVS